MTGTRRLGSAVKALLLSAGATLLFAAPAAAQLNLAPPPVPDLGGVGDGFTGSLPGGGGTPSKPTETIGDVGGQVGDTVKDTGGKVGGAVGGPTGDTLKDTAEKAGGAIKESTSKVVETVSGTLQEPTSVLDPVTGDRSLGGGEGGGKGKTKKSAPTVTSSSAAPVNVPTGSHPAITFPDSSGRFALAEALNGFNPSLLTDTVGAAQDVQEPMLLDEVIGEIAEAARRLAFPVALTLLVVGYVLFQNRVDRRDPKLSVATLDPDEDLLSFR